MVQGKRRDGLVAELSVRHHLFLSGVSEKNGGHDEAPSPHELVEAALTACTILTVQMYANRKGYKLESTDVVTKIISEGAETRIGLEISFRGDLQEDERKRLLEIAGKCPIHKLLESNIKIETTLQ
jgi:putative redox protein